MAATSSSSMEGQLSHQTLSPSKRSKRNNAVLPKVIMRTFTVISTTEWSVRQVRTSKTRVFETFFFSAVARERFTCRDRGCPETNDHEQCLSAGKSYERGQCLRESHQLSHARDGDCRQGVFPLPVVAGSDRVQRCGQR